MNSANTKNDNRTLDEIWGAGRVRDEKETKTPVSLYCKNCKYTGEALTIKGTKGIEIALWILGLFTYGIMFVAAIIYSVWRRAGIKPNTCPKCGWEMLKQDRE